MASVIIAGATGATGRELVKLAVQDENIARVVALTRQRIDDSLWPEVFKGILMTPALAKLEVATVDWEGIFRGAHRPDAPLGGCRPSAFQGHDMAFSCLGAHLSKTQNEEEFQHVDLDYVEAFGITVLELSKDSLFYFGHISAADSDANAGATLARVKGQADQRLFRIGFPYCTLWRPSLLRRRDRARFSEKISAWFERGVTCSKLAKAMLADASQYFRIHNDGDKWIAVETSDSTNDDVEVHSIYYDDRIQELWSRYSPQLRLLDGSDQNRLQQEVFYGGGVRNNVAPITSTARYPVSSSPPSVVTRRSETRPLPQRPQARNQYAYRVPAATSKQITWNDDDVGDGDEYDDYYSQPRPASFISTPASSVRRARKRGPVAVPAARARSPSNGLSDDGRAASSSLEDSDPDIAVEWSLPKASRQSR